MYKNRISRTTPNHNPQFFIRRSDIAFDDRVAYVESICAIWNEGRFGPGHVKPVVIDLSDRPEPEPARFSDLLDDEPNGSAWHDLSSRSPLGRAGYQVVEAAYQRAKQMGLVDVDPNERNSPAALPPNQGRGSP